MSLKQRIENAQKGVDARPQWLKRGIKTTKQSPLSGPPPLESAIEEASVLWARSQGWFSRKYKSPGNRSAPDRLYAHPDDIGIVIFIEYKRPGNDLTPQQLLEHGKMLAAGMLVYTAWSVEDTKRILNAFVS